MIARVGRAIDLLMEDPWWILFLEGAGGACVVVLLLARYEPGWF